MLTRIPYVSGRQNIPEVKPCTMRLARNDEGCLNEGQDLGHMSMSIVLSPDPPEVDYHSHHDYVVIPPRTLDDHISTDEAYRNK